MTRTEESNDARPTITEHDVTLTAADGYRLSGRLFEPRLALGTVVINGATAVPQRFYEGFSRHLAGAGLRVLTYDYRGIGRSRPQSLEGFAASMTEWARMDAVAAWRFARSLAPYDPVAVVGHSFGAQLVGLVDEVAAAAAAVFVGGQLGYYGYWRGVERIALGVLWHLGVPAITAAYGYLPGRFGIGEDLPSGVAREWARWCRSPGYLMSAHPDAAHRFRSFKAPTLSFGATDDPYAPHRAIQALLERLPAGSVTHRQLDPRDLAADAIGHFGFFRKNFEPTLWHDAATFLTDVFAGQSRPRTGTQGAEAPSDPSGGITMREIMADLSYGRA